MAWRGSRPARSPPRTSLMRSCVWASGRLSRRMQCWRQRAPSRPTSRPTLPLRLP
eukprot:SM006316S19847  [mRNA]  locus=s6316:56:805:- [translate_table: standard]